MRQAIAPIFLLVSLIGCATPRGGNSPALDVRAALAARYPDVGGRQPGDLQFDEQAPIEPVALRALNKALPDIRFFTTHLLTGYFEYWELEVAVAVNRQGPIAVYYSPVYDESPPTFVKLLENAQAADSETQFAVANDIASLFARITYKGAIRGAQFQSGAYSAELWHDHLYWRHISISFAAGHVSSVMLTNPTEAATQPGT